MYISAAIPELQQVKPDFDRFRQAIDEGTQALRQQLRKIVWTGPDFAAYTQEQNELTYAINDMSAFIFSIGGTVADSGTAYQVANAEAAKYFPPTA